jgi:hypothetical protein
MHLQGSLFDPAQLALHHGIRTFPVFHRALRLAPGRCADHHKEYPRNTGATWKRSGLLSDHAKLLERRIADPFEVHARLEPLAQELDVAVVHALAGDE